MTAAGFGRRLGLLVGGILAVLLVAVALVASVGRYYLQNVGQYHDFVLAKLHERTGLTLTAESLTGDWRRLIPELNAVGLALLDPVDGQPVLQAERVTLRLDLLRSVLAMAPRIQLLTASGVDIELAEANLGRWQLRGFSGEGAGDTAGALDLVLGIDRATLEEVQLQLLFSAGHTARVRADQLRLARAGEFRRFEAGLQLSPEQPPIELVIEAHGDPRASDGSRARGHARFVGVDLTPVLPLLEPLGIALQEGLVDGELWLEWLGERQFEAQGHLAIPVLDLAGLSGQTLEPLTALELNLQLRAEHGDWELWLPTLRAQWAEHSLALDQLWLQRRVDGSTALAVPRLALAPLVAAVSGSGLLDEDGRRLAQQLAPRGDLVRIRAELSPEGEASVRAELDNVGVNSWRGAPGADGVDGYIEFSGDSGMAVIDSRDLRLAFPQIYDQPLQIDAVTTNLRWRVGEQRLQLTSGPIAAMAELGKVAGYLELDLPLTEAAPEPPQMTLVLGLRDSHSRYRDLVIPSVLDPDLLDWLERAVGPAQLPTGGFIYRGSLRGGDEQARTVQLLLEVRDGSLDYHPPWPALHGIDAQVLVDDGRTTVATAMARALSHTRIGPARFSFDPANGRLSGSANLESADADLLQLLTATPLRDGLGGILDDWQWRGPASARLELDLSLRDDTAPPAVEVVVEIGPGSLEFGALGLTVTKLAGPLRYSTSADSRTGLAATGLSSTGLTGQLFGAALEATMEPVADQLRIALAAPAIAIADLQSWLQLPLPVDRVVDGSTAVSVNIDVSPAGTRLQARSDLRGVAVALPEPWHKLATDVVPLELAMPLPGGPLQLSIGEHFRLAWQAAVGADAPAGGALRLGSGSLPGIVPGQLQISGTLGQVDVAAWRDVIGRLGPLADGADSRLPLFIRDLRIAELPLLGQPFSAIRINGHSDASGWRLQVEADQLAGELVLPAPSGAPLAVWLGRLDLVTGPSAVANAGAGALSELDPTTVPELEFAVGALRIDGELLGGVRFDLQPLPDGLRLDALGGSLRGVSFSGVPDQVGARLDWRIGAGGARSEFRGRLLGGDLSRVLTGFGYEPALTSRRAMLDTNLEWRGRPDQLSLAGVIGDAALVIEDGRFNKVSEPASGALKALGIFNLANLTRRLRLDFSDIFNRGVSFNRLDGRFGLDQGVVKTLTPLRVDSPSSRFLASGEIDFNTDLMAMDLVATLPIASNLPWVVALAGGLPAAAGVYIVGKVFEEQMDRYSSVVYRINGEWTDPQVEFVRAFDDSDMAERQLQGEKGGRISTLPEREPE